MHTSPLTRALGVLALATALGACGEPETLDGAPIDVETPGGRVVVDRSPFGLRIEDTAGNAVLSLATATQTAGGVVYAPLAWSTGDEPELAYPVLSGSIDTNPASPTPPRQFAVTTLLSATTAGSTTTLTLATDDPGGGTLTVRVGPEGDAAIALEITAEGASALSATFASGADEAFHGFGGRRESTDLHGRQIRNWVLDYRFPEVSAAYYYAEPLFVSSRGYGLLLDQAENAVFRLDSDVADAWRVATVGPQMKLVVAPRPAAGAVAALTAITGRHRKPPGWSMGATISRAVQSGKTVADYQQAITDDLARIQSDALPVTAYCFEGAAQLPDAFVASTIATLTARGIHPVLYIRSFVGNDTAGTQAPGDYDAAIAGGYLATTSEGQPYLAPGPFDVPMAVVDFTSSAARAWWEGKVTAMLAEGADGFMNDFGEQVLSDMRFADGTTGVATHNRYPVLQEQAARETVDAFEAAHPGREIYFFGRAGYTGRPGSAAYENATFPGDELNDFSKGAGLPSLVPDMLNRAVGGAYGFTTDIAGYLDASFAPATKELYLRWSEAAALMPFFRVHNGPLEGEQMPWSYDAEVEDTWRAMAVLHASVLPDLETAWDEALATGMPVVRPLWLADPASAATPHNDDEWLVGADLLAAPVVEEGATQREVWLPTGCWQPKGAGAKVMGPKAMTVDAPLTELPWFRRCAAP